MSEAGAEVLII